MKKITILFTVLIAITLNTNAQWVQTSLDSGTVSCLAVSGTNIFAGTDGNGVYLSTDNGISWTSVSTGLTGYYAMYINTLAISGSNIFAGTFGDGVYLSSNNGNSWSAVNTGLPSYTGVNALAIKGSNIFAGTEDGGVYLSSNNGDSWSATALDTTTVLSFAVSGNNIFAGTYCNGVYLSTNNGNSWSAVNTGLPGNLYNVNVNAFAINGSNIFAGTYSNGVYLSSNNGNSWTAVNTGLINTNIFSLATSGNNIFEASNGGVYLSSNNGGHWTTTGMAQTYVASLLVSGSYIFAGLGERGVWKRPLSEISGIEETNNNASNISVYPNPAADRVFINISERKDLVMQIYNVVGECVLQRELNNGENEITISSLPKGIYVIKISGADYAIQRKLIKE